MSPPKPHGFVSLPLQSSVNFVYLPLQSSANNHIFISFDLCTIVIILSMVVLITATNSSKVSISTASASPYLSSSLSPAVYNNEQPFDYAVNYTKTFFGPMIQEVCNKLYLITNNSTMSLRDPGLTVVHSINNDIKVVFLNNTLTNTTVNDILLWPNIHTLLQSGLCSEASIYSTTTYCFNAGGGTHFLDFSCIASSNSLVIFTGLFINALYTLVTIANINSLGFIPLYRLSGAYGANIYLSHHFNNIVQHYPPYIPTVLILT